MVPGDSILFLLAEHCHDPARPISCQIFGFEMAKPLTFYPQMPTVMERSSSLNPQTFDGGIK
jgi:hypothetical protein